MKRPLIRTGKLNGKLVVYVGAGDKRRRYRLSRPGEVPYDLAQQIRTITDGYEHAPKADDAARQILYHRVRSAQSRSAVRGMDFDISLEWAIERYNEQEGCCLLTRLPFDIGVANAKEGRRRRPFRPSLDRIDSTGGYTKDNTRLVCSCVNYAMGAWGEMALRIMAASLLNE